MMAEIITISICIVLTVYLVIRDRRQRESVRSYMIKRMVK